jgi:hypothetical protein
VQETVTDLELHGGKKVSKVELKLVKNAPLIRQLPTSSTRELEDTRDMHETTLHFNDSFEHQAIEAKLHHEMHAPTGRHFGQSGLDTGSIDLKETGAKSARFAAFRNPPSDRKHDAQNYRTNKLSPP